MSEFFDTNENTHDDSRNENRTNDNVCEIGRNTTAADNNRIKDEKDKTQNAHNSFDTEELLNGTGRHNGVCTNKNIKIDGEEKHQEENKKENENPKNVTESEEENEDEMYSIPSDMDIEFNKLNGAEYINTSDDLNTDSFYDIPGNSDDFTNEEMQDLLYDDLLSEEGNSKVKHNKNLSDNDVKEYKNKQEGSDNNQEQNREKDKDGSKKDTKEKNKKCTKSQVIDQGLHISNNFDLREQIKSTIETCVPNIRSSKEAEERMLITMKKISNINLTKAESDAESEIVERSIKGLYENVDHIMDVTNKRKFDKEKIISVFADTELSTKTEQTVSACEKEKTDEKDVNKQTEELMKSFTQKQEGSELKIITNILEEETKKEKEKRNVEYYLTSSLVELDECINKLCSGSCDFKERNILTQKITKGVPELNNLYSSKNLCYIKDSPTVNEIAQIVPEWKNSFEKMNRRALEDTDDMIHILKRIKNMKHDLHMLNKDLLEDREEFENIKFETVEHEVAVTSVENKNKKYIKGALQLDNMGQKLKSAFNIPTNPLTNFTVSEHINRLLNYEEELLMGSEFTGKDSKPQHFEILRFTNNDKKFEMFEKEDEETCYVIDMLVSDLKKVYEEKKKEFENIDKKMKLYEMTDINKFKGFMDITLNNHNICINEFKESIKEAAVALFDLYEHFANKNLKVKKINDSYIKRYVNKEMLPLHNKEANIKKEKEEEKYFMSLNFTRKKPIDHPFFIYHCLSSTFLFYFVNFVLNPECLENQKDFMQHCTIPGFNSVVFCQQLLKLRKEEKKFTKADLSYDFTSAYAKVLCADLYSVVLKNVNDSNCMEEQTGVNKYLKALKNASEDFFQNTFKKKTPGGIYKPVNNTATNVSNILFIGNDKTNGSDTTDSKNIFHGTNVCSNATVDNTNASSGFQLLHYIPDELTSIRSRHTAICYDSSATKGVVCGSMQNCDINKFNILKVAPHPLLTNASNELFHRKMKQQAHVFEELCKDSETNVTANKYLLDSKSNLSNMGKDNFLTSKEGSIFGMQNRNVLGNNNAFNMFNQNVNSTNNTITNNNTTLLGGNSIFGSTNNSNNNSNNNNNNATSIFNQRNTGTLGNNTNSNIFGNTKSNTLFGNNNSSNIFGTNSSSSNAFSNQSGSLFNSTTNGMNKTSTFGTNASTPFTNSTTNSFLNNASGTSSSSNIFSNTKGNSIFNSTATNNIFGGQGQNKRNSFLNQGSGLTNNSLMNTTGFGISANTNTMNQSGMNTSSNIFGNTSSSINTSTSNANNIFNQNKTNIFSNTTAASSTGNLFAGTMDKFLGNNTNGNNMTGGTTGFGLLGKSGNTDTNTTNMYGNSGSANIFTGKTTNQTSSLFAPSFSSGTSSLFGNTNSNNLNNTLGSNNTNSAMNAFGLSNSTNQLGVNNNSNTLGSGNIFATTGNRNSSSLVFSNNNTVNNTNSLFGRNEALSMGNNSSIFGKTSMTTTGSSGLFGSTTNSLNNTGMMNNKNASSSGIFGNMGQQNNSPITSFARNNTLLTNTNMNFQSSPNSPFTSGYEQSTRTNSTSVFPIGNSNTTNNINNSNNSIFGMNNVSSGLSAQTGKNPNMGSSNIFGNKPSAGGTFSNTLFAGTGNFMSNNSFNNNSAFNTNQTSSFLGKTNPREAQNNIFSSKMNTNVFLNSSFNALNTFGGNTNSNANTNANSNAFGKSSFFGTTSSGPINGNKNVNTTGSIFNNTSTGSTSNLFASNSRMGMNSFSNSLSNTNMQSGVSSTNNSSLFSNTGRMFGSTNMLGSNANTNMNANNVNNNSSSLLASNNVSQNTSSNRSTAFGNAMDNQMTSNLFSKNNLESNRFMNNTNVGSANTGMFQNQQNTFATSNRQGTSIFGMSNNGLANNSLTNNNMTNSMFQNNSFMPRRENMTNTSVTPGTQNFNLQNSQNIFQQSMTSKSTTRNMGGNFFS